jgi:hypothetical protein
VESWPCPLNIPNIPNEIDYSGAAVIGKKLNFLKFYQKGFKNLKDHEIIFTRPSCIPLAKLYKMV